MSVFKYEKDADGIVTVTMDQTGPVNAMNAEYREAMSATVAKLEAEEGLTGVVIASAKKVFFAGGDLNELLAFEKGNEAEFMDQITGIKADFRSLEKLPVPVVAAINGAALGGGYELCLATNYRIAYNHKSVQIGLPEVSLGLLPGGGGVVRMVNMLGLQTALPYLLEGKKVTPEKALKAGMVNETVESLNELVPRAKAYILEQKGNEVAATQPWDQKGFKIPGGNANSPKLAQVMMGAPAMLAQKTRGLLPAPEQILNAAAEAARLDFDAALVVETRGLAYLAGTPEAKNMITTFFFQMTKLNSGASRPKDIEPQLTKKVGVLGAGMMGQGIAFVSAMAGIEVILKDISVEAAEKGKAYSEKLLTKRIARGRMTEEKKEQILALIKPTANNEDLQGCDLIIEAVFENIELKNKITSSTEQYLCEGGIWGSNTSTLPITQLAEASSKPENFIGVHFFSPVDKMPLVEIICGDKTSDVDTWQKPSTTRARSRRHRSLSTTRWASLPHAPLAPTSTKAATPSNRRRYTRSKIDNLGKAIGMPVGPLTISMTKPASSCSHKADATWE